MEPKWLNHLDHEREMELVQGVTMVPVFIVHSWFVRHTPLSALVGMLQSTCSFLLHMNLWWHQEEWTTTISSQSIDLYIADKCTIIMMMWGFHYYFDPFMACIFFLSCFINMVHIVLYQHENVDNKYAYYDVFLLGYIFQVVVSSILFLETRQEQQAIIFLFFCCMMGYMLEIPGLMHLSLTPSFWLWHETIKKIIRKK